MYNNQIPTQQNNSVNGYETSTTPTLIPQRPFRVNYRGGFSLTRNLEPISWLIQNNNDLTVIESLNLEKAYAEACCQFVQEEWRRSPYTQITPPKLEDVVDTPYRLESIIPKIPSRRFFATFSPEYVGIYTSVDGAVEFLYHIKFSNLKEFTSEDEATLWLNEYFLLPLFSISAYCTDEIEYIKKIPLNTAVQVYYLQWWHNHLKAINNLPFAQPQFLSLSEPMKDR